jgi:hypothetical protein
LQSRDGEKQKIVLALVVSLWDTTQQHNTHITDVREICYSWHPWHGRAVRVLARLVKRGQAVAYCSLEDVPACRVLEVPLWMLDVAACCKIRASQTPFATAQSLRDLKEVLQAARPQVAAPIASKTQPRYLLHAGGADGSIDGPAEIEPAPVVCSPQGNPHWTNLSSDVQQKIVRLRPERCSALRGTVGNCPTGISLMGSIKKC